MNIKNILITRKEYNIIAKSKGIQKPQKMFSEKLLNTLSRYDSKCKVKSIHRKLRIIGLEKITKIENISIDELSKAGQPPKKPIDELKAIARLRRIKVFEKLAKEDLILILLKSKSSALESNFRNNSTNDDDDTYDDKITGKITDIRMILTRQGNIIFHKRKRKIKKEIYEIEKNRNLSYKEKEKIYDYLIKLLRTLDRKEKYQQQDRDDLDYYRVKEIENLFDSADIDDYYKPILIKSSFKNNYKIHESKGDKK